VKKNFLKQMLKLRLFLLNMIRLKRFLLNRFL